MIYLFAFLKLIECDDNLCEQIITDNILIGDKKYQVFSITHAASEPQAVEVSVANHQDQS